MMSASRLCSNCWTWPGVLRHLSLLGWCWN